MELEMKYLHDFPKKWWQKSSQVLSQTQTMSKIFQYQVQQTLRSWPNEDLLDIPEGITTFKYASGSLILGTKDGSVHIYDVKEKKIKKI